MIDEMIRLLSRLPELQPIERLPARLDVLFARLQRAETAGEAYAIEDEIWALWTSHPEPTLATQMEGVIAAIAGRKFAEAQRRVDDLVRADPLWPEAWNKRATLAFLKGDDGASVRDIRRTLEMEPRHFGALSGLAQIALRQGAPQLACLCFEAALVINPHLAAARAALAALQRRHRPTVH
jgi:tetratricopeptide (TPR) repeat protein